MSSLSYLIRTPIPRSRENADKNTLRQNAQRYSRSRNTMLETIQTNRASLLEMLRTRSEKEAQAPIDCLGGKYGASIPWGEVLHKLKEMDMGNHLDKAIAAFESMQTARFLLNAPETAPNISQEELARIKLTKTKGPIIRIMSGLMLPPQVKPPGDLYLGYIIDHFGDNMDLFEEIEALLPQAGYRALVPPGRSGSKTSKTFFPTPRHCLRSLEEFKDSVKKYLVFDRGYRDKTAYSVQIEVSGVTLDLELWLAWKPKRVEIRKHMNQGTSLPPRKVIEFLERDEDLEVVAVRIPRWLKSRLEDEAETKKEQLGTHLRQRLEDIYT